MKAQSGKFKLNEERGEVSYLMLSPPSPRALLGLAHGAGAGMTHQNMESIAQAMASVGLATFRYNFSYMEMGKGRESSKVSIATVKEAAVYASQHFPHLPLLMGGHSYGGRMSTLAAAEGFAVPVKGLILFNFPLHAPGKPGLDRAAHLKNISLPSLFLSGSRDTFAQKDLLISALEPMEKLSTLHWLDTSNHGYKILKRSRIHSGTVFEEMAEQVDDWLSQTI